MSALVTSKIFRLFVNTLTPMTSIPIARSRLSDNKLKRLYLKKERLFVNFWLYFWIVDEIYNVLKTKKSILA